MNQETTFTDQLFASYALFREELLSHRRFKHGDILSLIDARRQHLLYDIRLAGLSFEGREIHVIKVGHGLRKVLLWTQMHGDEPTATMACFDILNFLEASDDPFDTFRESILDHTTLYFVPMLNPDGAERYQRRTAQNIDMNRDALALQTPESRILKELQETLKPEFSFNLHDKNPRYSVGDTNKLATISFLATAYDHQRSVNEVRKKSMLLIAGMNRMLQGYIPDQVGRWSEEHEPRAFGDNIQKWGSTLVLIESGGYAGDPEKQYIRKLNFMAILHGLGAIADNSFVQEELANYHSIPENSRYIFDLLVRNVTVMNNGKAFLTDLGINRNEINDDSSEGFFYQSIIEEYGDLSIYHGTEELDAEGLVLGSAEKGSAYPPTLEDEATFVLTLDGKVKYTVLNGFVSV